MLVLAFHNHALYQHHYAAFLIIFSVMVSLIVQPYSNSTYGHTSLFEHWQKGHCFNNQVHEPYLYHMA